MKTIAKYFIILLPALLLASCSNPTDPPSAIVDATAPTIGAAISFSGTSYASTTVIWGAASDDVTSQASLRYKLVRASSAAAIDTIDKANAISGADLVMDWTTDATSATATGLSSGSMYYFAVIVRDTTGNMAIYSPKPVTTAVVPNIVYDLNSAPSSSEWKLTGDWQWGTVTNVGPTGSICFGTNISGDYTSNGTLYGDAPDYSLDYVQLGPLDLRNYTPASGFRMTFKGWFEVDYSMDFCGIQYSTDGMNFTVVPAARVSGYNYISNNSDITEAWSPNGSSAGQEYQWRDVTIDLGGLGLNGKTTIYFRWALSSDNNYTDAGYYIDDIDIGY